MRLYFILAYSPPLSYPPPPPLARFPPPLRAHQLAELRERLAVTERELRLASLQREGGLGKGDAKLEEENRRLRQELEAARAGGGRSAAGRSAGGRAGSGEETALMRQVREFIRTTAMELETEVAQLTRRATVAEEQLVETNALLAQSALRGQREIGRLRHLLGRYDPAAAGYTD